MTEIKIVNKGGQQLPSYATEQSAGMDIRADMEAPVTLRPLERRLFHTGLYIALPPGFEAQMRPRSGLSLKHGITVINTPGTIDADYRGELCVALVNLSADDYTVQPGDRIAQMVISRYEKASLVPVSQLDDTERGAGGYGHTGMR